MRGRMLAVGAGTAPGCIPGPPGMGDIDGPAIGPPGIGDGPGIGDIDRPGSGLAIPGPGSGLAMPGPGNGIPPPAFESVRPGRGSDRANRGAACAAPGRRGSRGAACSAPGRGSDRASWVRRVRPRPRPRRRSACWPPADLRRRRRVARRSRRRHAGQPRRVRALPTSRRSRCSRSRAGPASSVGRTRARTTPRMRLQSQRSWTNGCRFSESPRSSRRRFRRRTERLRATATTWSRRTRGQGASPSKGYRFEPRRRDPWPRVPDPRARGGPLLRGQAGRHAADPVLHRLPAGARQAHEQAGDRVRDRRDPARRLRQDPGNAPHVGVRRRCAPGAGAGGGAAALRPGGAAQARARREPRARRTAGGRGAAGRGRPLVRLAGGASRRRARRPRGARGAQQGGVLATRGPGNASSSSSPGRG